jgi:hypothetical protein
VRREAERARGVWLEAMAKRRRSEVLKGSTMKLRWRSPEDNLYSYWEVRALNSDGRHRNSLSHFAYSWGLTSWCSTPIGVCRNMLGQRPERELKACVYARRQATWKSLLENWNVSKRIGQQGRELNPNLRIRRDARWRICLIV